MNGKAKSLGYVPTECSTCGKYSGHNGKACDMALANTRASKRRGGR